MNEPPKLDQTLREIFKYAYSYRQKYQNPQRTEAFWAAALEDARAICKQFDMHPFCQKLIVACYEDIEREMKEKEGSKNSA